MNPVFSMEMTLHAIILPHHLRPALSAEGDAIKSIDLVPAGCDLFDDLSDPTLIINSCNVSGSNHSCNARMHSSVFVHMCTFIKQEATIQHCINSVRASCRPKRTHKTQKQATVQTSTSTLVMRMAPVSALAFGTPFGLGTAWDFGLWITVEDPANTLFSVDGLSIIMYRLISHYLHYIGAITACTHSGSMLLLLSQSSWDELRIKRHHAGNQALELDRVRNIPLCSDAKVILDDV